MNRGRTLFFEEGQEKEVKGYGKVKAKSLEEMEKESESEFHGQPKEYEIDMSTIKYHSKVFMEFKIDDEIIGEIHFGLFDKTRITSENFRALCTGEKGIGQTGKNLHYKGNPIHLIMPQLYMIGGDLLEGKGSEAEESIYGGFFDNENFIFRNNKRGVLGMANHGPKTNGCKFYITFSNMSAFDRCQVAFGHMIQGDSVLDQIELAGSNYGPPTKKVIISNCGQL